MTNTTYSRALNESFILSITRKQHFDDVFSDKHIVKHLLSFKINVLPHCLGCEFSCPFWGPATVSRFAPVGCRHSKHCSTSCPGLRRGIKCASGTVRDKLNNRVITYESGCRYCKFIKYGADDDYDYKCEKGICVENKVGDICCDSDNCNLSESWAKEHRVPHLKRTDVRQQHYIWNE
ncbi:hypothetical protein CSKR_105764 [Clonorchis sinensis]|uniref:Uncharacterized protein n=1 Tax=Clonorchis sinensis TaxID=79923 RepID=A0A3R7FHX5_CLOSI|nr:hypothetical protein CSKR_105764 [Clonorchis sinensis]